MTKKKANPVDRPVPKHDGYRGGAKVAWYYYKNEADAREAAAGFRELAERRAAQGYDFGFCSPGSVQPADKDGPYAGMWEVCAP